MATPEQIPCSLIFDRSSGLRLRYVAIAYAPGHCSGARETGGALVSSRTHLDGLQDLSWLLFCPAGCELGLERIFRQINRKTLDKVGGSLYHVFVDL